MRQTKITNTKSVILAIYPHMKTIGYAVMDSPTSVKKSGYRYISAHDKQPYLGYVAALIKLYDPNLIILEDEKSRKQFRAKYMQQLFWDIEEVITQLSITKIHYSRVDIRNQFGPMDKMEIARQIAEIFPRYINRIPKPRVSTDGPESPKMSEFDALSLCITHYSLARCKAP